MRNSQNVRLEPSCGTQKQSRHAGRRNVAVLPGASSNVANQVNKLERVNQLIEWAESNAGPGLDQLVLAGQRLRLFSNFS